MCWFGVDYNWCWVDTHSICWSDIVINVIYEDSINTIELYRNDGVEVKFVKFSVIIPLGYSLMMTKTTNVKSANPEMVIVYDNAIGGNSNGSNASK